MNEYLGQYALFLNKLIFKEDRQNDKDIVYNKVDFQGKQGKTATCGRHVVNRLLCLLHYNMNLQQYVKFMKKCKNETGFTYDELVCTIIQ